MTFVSARGLGGHHVARPPAVPFPQHAVAGGDTRCAQLAFEDLVGGGMRQFVVDPHIARPRLGGQVRLRGQELLEALGCQGLSVSQLCERINLSYTINLNLPATTDIEVFNAIFKSLKQHLIQE